MNVYKDIKNNLKDSEEKKCILCGKPYIGYGNNPEPLANKGKCCDLCNTTKVIPERVRIAQGKNLKETSDDDYVDQLINEHKNNDVDLLRKDRDFYKDKLGKANDRLKEIQELFEHKLAEEHDPSGKTKLVYNSETAIKLNRLISYDIFKY